ncbi:MAG: glycosyltransferase family 2 protein [Herpetosiphon sp.]|nr:glycosyltransferase family 2 protein [Herpetosiphon sp.]
MNIQTIIVTWNQTDLTLKCVASLVADGVQESTIWLVDNASNDPALPHIHAQFPAIHGVRLEQNCGFAGGCNIGASHALDHDPTTEALFFFNNDAETEPHGLAQLADELQSQPDIAAVSPKVYYAGTDRIIQSTGLTVDRDSGHVRMMNANQPDQGQADTPADREALFGCAMLIRADVWRATNGFWDAFFNYAEEVDWCVRVRRSGWRLRYVPSASVWHNTSSSLGWNSPLKIYLMTRNQWWLRERHRSGGLGALRGWLYAVYVLTRTAFRYLRQRQWRQAWAIWLGTWDYWQGITGNARTRNLAKL